MNDQEKEQSKIGETIKEGAKALFNRLPVSAKIKIIGIAAAVVVSLFLVIIIIAGSIGPLMEVRDKLIGFFTGKTTSQEQFVSIEEYNFYKTFSDINEKYSNYIDGPLVLATLFFNTDDDNTIDQKCYDSTGGEVSCISPMGINYYGKANEYAKLVAQMLDINQVTYHCVPIPGTDNNAYTRDGIVEEKVIDSSSKDITTLLDGTCEGPENVYSYTFSQNKEKYDDYLFDTYLQQHPIRFELPYLGINVSDDIKNTRIEEIHEKAEQFRPLYEEILISAGGVVFGNVPSNLLYVLGLPISNPYSITSCMGIRLHPVYNYYTQHNGIDLVSSYKAIYSTYDGIVEKIAVQRDSSGNVSGAGYYIVIKHDVDGAIYYSQYFHLVMNSALVSVGDTVTKGQQIATMGSTGVGTGVHLHFELRNASKLPLNPGNMFTGATSIDTDDPNCSLIGV